MRIYLTGFMGSGKSYAGRRIAEGLRIPFFDLDHEIEIGEERKISELFAKEGEVFFRKKEQEYLHQLTEKHSFFLLATGGGTPCFFDNADYMNAKGLVLFIETPVKVIVERLKKETAQRPLVAGRTDAQLADYVQVKLAERQRYYDKADIFYQQKTGTMPIVEEVTQYMLRLRKGMKKG